jgi:hypothetical protein
VGEGERDGRRFLTRGRRTGAARLGRARGVGHSARWRGHASGGGAGGKGGEERPGWAPPVSVREEGDWGAAGCWAYWVEWSVRV